MLEPDQAAVLEAILDPRISIDRGGAPGVADLLHARGLLAAAERDAATAALTEARTGRAIEWASGAHTHGEILEAFVRHCATELDDVTVVEAGADVLVTRWRDETSRLELRAGLIGIEQLVSEEPTMLIGVIGDDPAPVVTAFLDNEDLRTKLAVTDLTRLERIGTPRSAVFVYFEWFLREVYGVKLLPAAAFTQGLIDRGIISLGMG
jgi:hypothetical protein